MLCLLCSLGKTQNLFKNLFIPLFHFRGQIQKDKQKTTANQNEKTKLPKYGIAYTIITAQTLDLEKCLYQFWSIRNMNVGR